jgi:putative ABC transport system substrate-binding protein
MGLKLKYGLVALVASVALCLGCAKRASTITFVPRSGTASHSKSQSPDAKTILVVMSTQLSAERVFVGMKGELSSDFNLAAVRFDDDASVFAMSDAIRRTAPACIVLMNNSNVRLYARYQQALPEGTQYPPAIIVMTSFLQDTVKSIKNATGISYEIPGAVQFVKVRSMIDAPVRKVGVVYRKQFADFISEQRRLASREGIDLVGQEVGQDPSDSDVSNALKSLVERDRVDAVWVLNDETLVSPRMLSSVWLSNSNPRHRMPVIVGAPNLVTKEHPVGTFAIMPDDVALGIQAANLIFDIADDEWKISGREVSLPISIKTVVDANEVRQRFVFKEGALDGVDKMSR